MTTRFNVLGAAGWCDVAPDSDDEDDHGPDDWNSGVMQQQQLGRDDDYPHNWNTVV